ncbi:unnamed protein product [Euphydryas editha]|uniref:Uncharacterized protein n=1 Tax=Euphydryas editha TaxID=104508 RepID=A0AAU9TVX9_EUPED|nr:unnamed protein product [Euphydryas editha]
MRAEEIESILKRLENGEISEDDSTDNEDDIDYYSSQRDRLMELEDEEDVGNFPTDPNLDADPPAANFAGNTEYSQEIMNLDTPFQFFSYFFGEEI